MNFWDVFPLLFGRTVHLNCFIKFNYNIHAPYTHEFSTLYFTYKKLIYFQLLPISNAQNAENARVNRMWQQPGFYDCFKNCHFCYRLTYFPRFGQGIEERLKLIGCKDFNDFVICRSCSCRRQWQPIFVDNVAVSEGILKFTGLWWRHW